MFELPSKDGNITPEKRVNHDKCSFTTKQHMFGVFGVLGLMRSFAIDEPSSSVRALYATLVTTKDTMNCQEQ